ncbi:MAG: dTMP kinase [Gemmatimonadaceae bacterium]|nr:dTMP kinase [Gemmatimonadaceae bacterium]
MAGRLVVFEGGEGAGKTTQLERLALRLGRHGVQVRMLREPGGTPIGDEIRALLLRPGAQIPARTEALLFMASRAALMVEQVRPALDRGEIVLLDRFFLSTYAYQVGGRGLPEAEVRDANAFATGGLVPDVTVLLTLPVEVGLARAAQRGAADRMEQAERAFHDRVNAAFSSFAVPAWQAAHAECGRIVAVAADGPVEAVEERVWQVVATACPEVQG